MYEITIRNDYLGESRVVRSSSLEEAQMKATAQLAKWAEKEASLRELEAIESECASKNAEARSAIEGYRTLLRQGQAFEADRRE